ncbi:MFS general substrate transporter [Sodiomyces alkalinus F11]|uniref:MFS general substrate transporter n=1 Tax=Sodiomyces alkalinus (strain CBS 110278 / VKM F-3762 / F11) TaxID=1314773 RepID=A0A3N2Q2H4_SODAK|nr:MFS general substrate transporter [Sodiomyces alkalinus F11]ROT40971.1 MFS general substrate transporter [Sodiomyces alkalinus F11]
MGTLSPTGKPPLARPRSPQHENPKFEVASRALSKDGLEGGGENHGEGDGRWEVGDTRHVPTLIKKRPPLYLPLTTSTPNIICSLVSIFVHICSHSPATMSSTEVPNPNAVNSPPKGSAPDVPEGRGSGDKRDNDEIIHSEDPEVQSIDMDSKNQQRYGKIDKELAKYVAEDRIYISPERNDELRRKVDRRVLVVMILTYFLQAIDKGTISFASIMGLPEDTGLVDASGGLKQEFSWLTTVIYLATLVVEYPQNWLLARVPIAKYLSGCIIAWGTVLACHAACRNFTGLVIVRTLLGTFESVCQPAFVLLSSMWYRREEQAARVTYWYMMNGAQQIVGGLLAYCFSLITSGPLKSWQWLFLSYGIISVIYGFWVGWWMPDSPMRAKCFTEEEKHEMVERVRDNQTGIQNREFKKKQFVEGLADPQVWGYCMISICTTLPTSGLGAFANIIINSFGFSVLETQLLAMVLGFYIIIVLMSSSWLVKKTSQNLWIMLVYCIPSFVGTILLMTVLPGDRSRNIGLLISYYITLSFWAAQTLALSLISRNIAGQTKKTVAVALNFICWAAGNAIGPQVFLSWDAPRYYIAFATHLGCYSVLVLVIMALRFYLVRQNKKRDALAAAGVQEASKDYVVHAWEDLTDRENLTFRYAGKHAVRSKRKEKCRESRECCRHVVPTSSRTFCFYKKSGVVRDPPRHDVFPSSTQCEPHIGDWLCRRNTTTEVV